MRAQVHQPGQGRAVKRPQTGLFRDAGDDRQIETDTGGIAVHAFGHLCLDAEQLGETVFIEDQGFVQIFRADEHDLEIQLQGLGIDALGTDGGVRGLRAVFDAQGIGSQGPQQAFPGVGMLQQVFRPQDEEAAVGLVQAPGPYEGEVRHQGAQFRFPFDTAQQVG